MKQNGNVKVNQQFNPQNSKPPIPLDVDEVDGVLERYIRQKYDHQSFTAGSSYRPKQNMTRKTSDHYEETPPLPPKPGRRFGFGLRSASSAFPLHFNGPASPPRSPPISSARDMESLRINKQSRVFGTNVGGSNDNIDTKLAQLRDMGFSDDKRNVSVLKGFGGNLNKTVEQLVRLGEGSAPNSRSRTPIQPKASIPESSNTSVASSGSRTNGLSFAAIAGDSQVLAEKRENTPSVLPPQPAATRNLSPLNPYAANSGGSNTSAPPTAQPNGVPSIDQAFSNMQISQQPLFPNATGGYPNPPSHYSNARFQTMTPPVPQPQYMQASPYAQQTQNVISNTNPFFQGTPQPQPFEQPLYTQPNTIFSHNPFLPSSATSSPQLAYQTDSPQTYFQPQPTFPQAFQAQQYLNTNNDAFSPQQAFTHPPPHQSPYQTSNLQQSWNPFQQQAIQPQPTGRLDKTSILALYNYPQLAPQQEMQQGSPDAQANVIPAASNGDQPTVPQRSVTMPVQSVSGNKNPFQSAVKPQTNPTAIPPSIGRHVSQESIDMSGFQNGRHSPDAFASLSARYVR